MVSKQQFLAFAGSVLYIVGFGIQVGHAANCKCLGEAALEQALGQHSFASMGGKRCLPVETSSGLVACYPTNYGTNCSAHDDRLPSTCADMQGRRVTHRPSFCNDAWCYVDTLNCGSFFPSSWFPNLFYSYKTCGSTNSWADHINGNHETVSAMIPVISDYVKSGRSTLESSWRSLNRNENDDSGWFSGGRRRRCSVTTGCDCPDCKLQTEGPWKFTELDFANSAFYRVGEDSTPDENEECLLQPMHSTYEAIAAKEDSQDRYGYLYSGLQSDGSLIMWPAQKWCPTDYDARLRPWYASAASGPKDVVLVIDCSGSMRGERESLSRAAAKAVIDTLVDVDHAVIVGFSSWAKSNSLVLQSMTEANKQAAKNWIDLNIDAYGGTKFRAGFGKAFDILSASRAQNVTAGCKTLILFLSDGDPQDWGSDGFEWLQTKNEEAGDTVMFTYAIGAGITPDGIAINKRIACDNRGIFHRVLDSAELKDVMANYYMYMGVGADAGTVRWRDYLDAALGRRLLAACLPAFDKLASPKKLIGVNCVDMNTLIDLDILEKTDGYADFMAEIVQEQSYCAPFRLSGVDMQWLRHAYSPESVCDAGSGSPPIICGDGVRDVNPTTGVIEACDDGNTMSGDGCSATCQVEEGFVCPIYGYSVLSGDFTGYMKRPNVYCHGQDLFADTDVAIGSKSAWDWCRQDATRLDCAAWCGMQGNCSGFNWYEKAWGMNNACCFRRRASTKEYHTNTECYEKLKSRSEQIQCSNFPGFVDEMNFKCHDWVGYQCDAATSDYGYSAEGQMALENNCPSSCGYCSGDVCHVDCSSSVGAPAECRDCKGEWGPWSACSASKILTFGDKIQCLQERVYDITDHGMSGGAGCPFGEGQTESRKLDVFVIVGWEPECLRPGTTGPACGEGVRMRTVQCVAPSSLLCAQVQAQATWITEAQCFGSTGCQWQEVGWNEQTGCHTGVKCESANEEDCGDKPKPNDSGCYFLISTAHASAWPMLATVLGLLVSTLMTFPEH